MTTIPDTPKPVFRPSMLIYDTRYRSLTIQVVVLFLVMAGAAWLIDNAINNLRALGKDFNYGFLGVRAGYDINQRLIAYDSNSTHGRAMLVGLLNTLLLAVMSCALATVIGVIAGVLRLSGNWVVARLMTVYVEAFRNIPTLLWILVFGAIMSESMPAPSAFRGDDPAASMILFDSIAITNRGVYAPEPLFDRSLGNIDLGLFLVSIDLIAIVAVIVAGLLGHRWLIRNADAIQNATGKRPVTWWKSLLVLFLPLIVLLWALGFHFGYPELAGFNFVGGIHMRNSLIAMWLALSIYTGAFIAEIVRAGIMAVSRGQTEAAYALGLRPNITMNKVILPQALRVIIPPMISQYLNITKNTSLALAVGYMDLRSTLGGITLNQTGRELEAMLLMMLIYLIISLLISAAMNVYNSRVRLKER
ncbi:amino acid ABC transporter permease [Halodurantibacterium flavum]|uniref:Amino acid ABC transporter permease n=1 Tax=Halodurantibacterium flavum TaxID=1382802 RepID=A0ABW4S3H3_9RHOB